MMGIRIPDDEYDWNARYRQDFYDEADNTLRDAGIVDEKAKLSLATLRELEDTEDPECLLAWGIWDDLGLDRLHALAILERWEEFHKWEKLDNAWNKRFKIERDYEDE